MAGATRSRAPAVDGSVVVGSAVRLAGTAMSALFAGITGVATARALGPSDKGTLATISFLVALASTVASLGIGDALVVRARASAVVVRASTASVFGRAALVAIPCGIAAAAVAALVVERSVAWPTLALTAVAVVPWSVSQVARRLSDGTGRHGVTAASMVALGGTTAVLTILAVNVFGGGVTAAIAASAVGAVVAVVVHQLATARVDVAQGERITVPYAAGLPFMLALVARSTASRLDVLVLYLLAGPGAAGVYSVAITIGDVALYPAFSLAATVFGPSARGDHDDDRAVLAARIARLARAALVVGLVVAAVSAVVLPALVPAVFGDAFEAAVVPAIVLTLAAAPASAHWVISRVAAARGAAGLATSSLLAGVAVTLALDLVQGASLTPLRAAMASAIGGGVALLVAVAGIQRRVAPVAWSGLVPRPADLAGMVRAVTANRGER